jgi:hypothetical protein
MMLTFGIFMTTDAAKTVSKGQLLVINKQNNTLTYFQDGRFVKEFRVGTGMTPDMTPEGKWQVVSKFVDPYYNRGKIPGGIPENPLGPRWMGINANGTYGELYGIHGNNNENSIGGYVSEGCIRMYNDSVKWLYERIELGATVLITTSGDSAKEIAEASGFNIGAPQFTGKLSIDGEEHVFTVPPIEAGYTVYVPLRELVTAMGGTIRWDNAKNEVTGKIGNNTFSHATEAAEVTLNGQTIPITPSIEENGTIMMPLRDFGKLVGYAVRWDGNSQTAYLNS